MSAALQATPQPLAIHKEKITESFFMAAGSSDNTIVHGSAVTSPDAPGTIAYTSSSWGIRNGEATQRILVSVHSPQGMPFNKTLEFHTPPEGAALAGQSLPGLALSVFDGLFHETLDSAEYAANSTFVPLLMGPGSVALGQPQSAPSEEELAGILGGLLGIATTVIPAVAPVALDVAKQLFSKNGSTEEELGGIFDTIADIAKVAVPIAGNVLTAVGKSIN